MASGRVTLFPSLGRLQKSLRRDSRGKRAHRGVGEEWSEESGGGFARFRRKGLLKNCMRFLSERFSRY